MSLLSLTLVVLAAFIHATWNLLSKRAADAGPTFVFAYNMFACLVYLPWMIWLLVYGDLHWSLPVAGCLVLSACIHLAYSLCLQRGYQVADLSVVYPIARGTGPMLSSIGAFILLRETPTAQGILGCSPSSSGSASLPRRAIFPRSAGRAASTACAGGRRPAR